MKNNNKKIKNVFLGHTLEEYKARYDIEKTIHIDKHAVDEFNKSHRKDPKNSPLDGRLWWLIDDVYYEIDSITPKVNKHKKNKGPGFKIAMAGILGGLCIGGVGAGSYLIVKNFKKDENNERQIEIIGDEGNVNFSRETGKDNELNIILACEETVKEVYKAIAYIGNLELPMDDYLFNQATQTVIIPKQVLDNNTGNITIKAELGKKINNHVKSISCPTNFSIKVGQTVEFTSLGVGFSPAEPCNEDLYITCNDSRVTIDNSAQTISCSDKGSYQLTIRSKDNPNATGNTILNATYKILTIEDKGGDITKLMNFDINSSRTIVLKLDGVPVRYGSMMTSGPIKVTEVSPSTSELLITPTKEKAGLGTIGITYTDENGISYGVSLYIEVASYDELQIFKHYASGDLGRFVVRADRDQQFKNKKIYLPTRYYYDNGTKYEYGDIINIGQETGDYDTYGFAGTNIESIVVSESHAEGTGKNISYIGEGTFSGCTSLSDVSLSPQISTIEKYAFRCYTDSNPSGVLSSINLKDLIHLTTIEDEAFAGQKTLASIQIPAKVTSLGNKSFNDCLSLATVIIDSPTVAHSYNVYSNLIDKATTLKITKNLIEAQIDSKLIEGFTKSSPSDDYYIYIKN